MHIPPRHLLFFAAFPIFSLDRQWASCSTLAHPRIFLESRDGLVEWDLPRSQVYVGITSRATFCIRRHQKKGRRPRAASRFRLFNLGSHSAAAGELPKILPFVMNEIDWKKRPFYAIWTSNRGLELAADINVRVINCGCQARATVPSVGQITEPRDPVGSGTGDGKGRRLISLIRPGSGASSP